MGLPPLKYDYELINSDNNTEYTSVHLGTFTITGDKSDIVKKNKKPEWLNIII